MSYDPIDLIEMEPESSNPYQFFITTLMFIAIFNRYQKPKIDRKLTLPSPVQRQPTQYKM